MPPRPRHPRPAPASGAGAATAQAREIEWQLAAPDLAAVRSWLERHPALGRLRIEPLSAQQLHDTYLDTEDWRVFRAGFALRLREADGRTEATLKSLHSARGDMADRQEISEPLAGSDIEALGHATGPVASRVHDVAGTKSLRTLFELRTSRQRFAVRSRHPDAAVGEIALDETRFSRGNGHRHPQLLTRVELEAAGPDPTPLEPLVQRLCAECGLHPATENKFAAGLRSTSLQPPRLEQPGRKAAPAGLAIDASTRAGDFAAATLRRLLEEWRAHEPAARLGESREALHALRVTGRRMDTVLGLFAAHLPGAVRAIRPRLKSLIDALGPVRDADVRLAAVGPFRDGLPEEDRRALEPLLRRLESERAEARAVMLRALDAKPARHGLDTLSSQLTRTEPAGAASPPDAAALIVVPELIRKRYRKLRKCARRLTADSPLGEFHKVRVRAKKLRYALELVAATYARPADEMLTALHKLQSELGTQHDAGAIEQYLQQLVQCAPADFTAEALFLMGRMAERHARAAGRQGRKVQKAWRKVQGKHWKALRSRMDDLRRSASRDPRRKHGLIARAAHGRGGRPVRRARGRSAVPEPDASGS